VPSAHEKFPRTCAALETGIRDGLHLGAQLYVSRVGEVLIDEGFGEAREGVPMTRDAITLWFSAGKPLTAIAVAQLAERNLLTWKTRVAEIIPEFARGGKEHITLAHVLTHTAGLDALDPTDPALQWEEKLAKICRFALPLAWVAGERAGYSSTAGWYVLGEIVQRLTGEPIQEHVRKNILTRCAMTNSSLAFTTDELQRIRLATSVMLDTSGEDSTRAAFWNSDAGFTTPVPGGSARGPIRELGKFYEALLRDELLQRETFDTVTARQRDGMFDETFQFKTDVSYGFILNSNLGGFQMPYGYGRAASRHTFGHSGNQSSCAFADPERQLVVAWACNGMPGERRHQQRQRAINNAIYEDFGVTA
jgi:CubicO group peptidase (beta-lactamase class C family)